MQSPWQSVISGITILILDNETDSIEVIRLPKVMQLIRGRIKMKSHPSMPFPNAPGLFILRGKFSKNQTVEISQLHPMDLKENSVYKSAPIKLQLVTGKCSIVFGISLQHLGSSSPCLPSSEVFCPWYPINISEQLGLWKEEEKNTFSFISLCKFGALGTFHQGHTARQENSLSWQLIWASCLSPGEASQLSGIKSITANCTSLPAKVLCGCV